MKTIFYFFVLFLFFQGLIFAQNQTAPNLPTSSEAMDAETLKRLDEKLKQLQQQVQKENEDALKRIEDAKSKAAVSADGTTNGDLSKTLQKRLEDQHASQRLTKALWYLCSILAVVGIAFGGFWIFKKRNLNRY